MELRTSHQRKKSSRNSTRLKTAVITNDEHEWTSEEDSLLRAGIYTYGGKRWKAIAERIERWPPEECKRRWNQLQSLGEVTKRPWTPEEDTQMLELITTSGASKWAVIASYLPGRNGKQCRERWHNQLNPSIKKSPWTEEENATILRMQNRYGNSWAKITAKLPGRTDNAVKNHWHSSLKARAKLEHLAPVVRKSKATKKAWQRKSKAQRASKKQAERAAKGDQVATPSLFLDTSTKPVTRAASATATAAVSLPQAKQLIAITAASLVSESLSPDTVSTVDIAGICAQPFDDGLTSQAVIDSILDPMGMGTYDFDPPEQKVCEMTFERCMADWRAAGDDFYVAASNALTPADPTSPAQPPFGMDELLYDSLHDVCGGGLESAALPLTTSLAEVTKAPPYGYEYVTPDLSPLDHEEGMRFHVKEEPPPVKREISLVERNFTPEISCAGFFSSELGVEI